MTIEILEVKDSPADGAVTPCATCKNRVHGGRTITSRGGVTIYLCELDKRIARTDLDTSTCISYELDGAHTLTDKQKKKGR